MNLKKSIPYGLYFIPAVLFLFSGVAKLFPIHSFEFLLVQQDLSNWSFAPYLARLVILAELVIGVGFLFGSYYKRFYLPVSLAMLMVFNLHLIYTMIGGTGGDNCGCFGELLPMTPFQALLKNIILMGFLVFLWFRTDEKPGKISLHIVTPFILAAILFLVFPVTKYQIPVEDKTEGLPAEVIPDAAEDPAEKLFETPEAVGLKNILTDTTTQKKLETVSEKLPKKTSVFGKYKNFMNYGVADLDAGGKIVALFSLDCDHCMNFAKSMVALQRQEKKMPPVFALFLGEETQLEAFFAFAGGELPWMIIPAEEFFPLLNASPPRVVYLQNGNLIKDWDNSVNIEEELNRLIKTLK